MPTSHNMIIYHARRRRQGVHRGADPRGHRAGDHPHRCATSTAAYAVAVRRGYPAGTFPGWDIVGLVVRRVAARAARRRDHHRGASCPARSRPPSPPRSPVLWALLLSAHRLPQAHARALPQGGRQGRQDHRHGPAADRHLRDVRLPDRPVRRRRAHRQGAGDRDDQLALDDLPPGSTSSCSCSARFLDMAATILICTPIFLPICQQLRHEHPSSVRHRHADQLCALGPQHAAGGHHAVRRLRDRRASRSAT
jgi:hypothetical protein